MLPSPLRSSPRICKPSGARFKSLLRAALPPRARAGPLRSRHARSSLRGLLATAPLVLADARLPRLRAARTWTRWRRAPLLVLCHGCRQTPEDIAERDAHRRARRPRRLARAVAATEPTPRTRGAAGTGSSRTPSRGDGEAAIVAAQIVAVRRQYRADRKRVSSRACRRAARSRPCSACAIRGSSRGVFVHSGLACGAASSPRHGAHRHAARPRHRCRANRRRRARRRSAALRSVSAARHPGRPRRRRRAAQRRRRSSPVSFASTRIRRAAKATGRRRHFRPPMRRRAKRVPANATACASTTGWRDGRVVVRHVARRRARPRVERRRRGLPVHRSARPRRARAARSFRRDVGRLR